ncbi:PDR/VanB family oxidoreductase [Amycolatopsis sp. CA-161197]|uniref:PDR/VanB family oxidoreductase n=1 Tax=Amycolatopsis sp. CA-161197 TaxID=3239922 RepID=UPI003D8F0F0A
MTAPRRLTATVVAATEAAEGVRSLRLQLGKRVHAAPGSHVDVVVHLNGRDETRSYSVVAHDPEAGTIDLGIRLGATSSGGSRYLHGLTAGDRLRVTEPVQTFPLTRGRPGYTLVAGGIGITALLPMFRTLVAQDADVRLVYAGRGRATMAFLDQLDHPRVDVVAKDEGRVINPDRLVADLPEGHELYVCGPIGLLEALRSAWHTAGRPASHFRFETFGSSGRHPAEEFVVEIPRLSLRTTVPANRSLLDALEAAGAELMSDCRRGECGLCEVKVLGCTGIVDHRDVFLSPEQHAQDDHLCTCVSRAASVHGEPATLVLDVP